jgi:hypothetical protein
MTFTDESGALSFDFSGFDYAIEYDIPETDCAGLKKVDFIAENSSAYFFIEAKNYVNISDDSIVQAAMSNRRHTDYKMLTDPVAAFPLEIGMLFKDSILRWLASGKEFQKPITLLLVINPPPELQARDRERLIEKIRNGYIPCGMNKKPKQYPKITPLFFDMLTASEVYERYGFSVTVQTLNGK